MSRLAIVEVAGKQSKRERLREELNGNWNRHRGAVYEGILEEDRKRRIWQFLRQNTELAGKRVLDVGYSELTERIHGLADLTVIDAVEEALQSTTAKKQCAMLPRTGFSDASFHLAVCTDVIAEVPKPQRRLALSELRRVLKADGTLICSTSLCLRTSRALECFLALLETEFSLERVEVATHGLARKCKVKNARWLLAALERVSRRPSWAIALAHKCSL